MSFVFLEALSMEDMEKLALHYLVVVIESIEADRALLDYISNRLALADFKEIAPAESSLLLKVACCMSIECT